MPFTQTRLLEVSLSQDLPRQHTVQVGASSLTKIGQACHAVLPSTSKVLILTDKNIEAHYANTIKESLLSAGYKTVLSYSIQPGESSKTITQAQQIYTVLVNANFTRKDAILGLGGGVVGDLAGYCASTYHRGMNLIHVPTSLVAQVDSAMGGKTAVNFAEVKNMVGTFYQPKLVYTDTRVLETLPAKEWSAGMAEVIKYGLIERSCMPSQSGFFDWLLQHASADTIHHNMVEMIERCCAIKIATVVSDEFETKGLRFFLNLGHTFGHAYEALSNYQPADNAQPSSALLHGEAVAIGMVKATQLSVQLGLFPSSTLLDLSRLYQAVGLSNYLLDPLGLKPEALLEKMKKDKKNRDNTVQLILPTTEPGLVTARNDIPDATILDILKMQSLNSTQ